MFISIFMFMSLIILMFLKSFQMMYMYMYMYMLLYMFITMINFSNLSYMNCNNIYMFSDQLSLMMMYLTLFIILMMFLSSFKTKSTKESFFIYFFLNNILMLCFNLNNFYLFYIFFEFSLVPLILLMMLKGMNYERFLASLYMLMFTMSTSMIFLLLILFMKLNLYINLNMLYYFNKMKSILWILMLLVFLVKFPLYGFHIWLPKAHVESPVEGSMLLAGVLLKLGMFGLMRLMYFINYMKYINMLLTFSLVGSLISSFICLRQIDMKIMIAYSSVSHMGLLIGGLLSLTQLGAKSSIMMCLAHGFCSSGLFYMMNIYYEKFKTRNIYMLKGVNNFFPVLANLWMIMTISNMGTPPSMNFTSEILLVVSMLNKSLLLSLILSAILFLSIAYGLNMFFRLNHGYFYMFSNVCKDSMKIMFLSSAHIIFLFFYLFFMKLIMI